MTKQERKEFIKKYQTELIEYGIEKEFYDMKLSQCETAVIFNGWEWVEFEDAADQVLDDILEEKDLSVEETIELIGGKND